MADKTVEFKISVKTDGTGPALETLRQKLQGVVGEQGAVAVSAEQSSTRQVASHRKVSDFDRFFEHIAQFDPGAAPQRIGEILEAIQILTHSPLIGRPVKDGKYELVIGRATRGYVAAIDTVFLLAVRAQREAGFKSESGP